MPETTWQKLYKAAVLELDPKIKGRALCLSSARSTP
jgi:hypothetical protein